MMDFERYAEEMLGPMYLDRVGNPITLGRWMDLHGDPTYARVALTEIGGVWQVSTIWLGTNHGHGGPPLIFETMVFEIAESHGYVGPSRWGGEFAYTYHEDLGEQWRYSTERQAREGHEVMVGLVRQRFLPAVVVN
jgi:hypothetical protein